MAMEQFTEDTLERTIQVKMTKPVWSSKLSP